MFSGEPGSNTAEQPRGGRCSPGAYRAKAGTPSLHCAPFPRGVWRSSLCWTQAWTAKAPLHTAGFTTGIYPPFHVRKMAGSNPWLTLEGKGQGGARNYVAEQRWTRLSTNHCSPWELLTEHYLAGFLYLYFQYWTVHNCAPNHCGYRDTTEGISQLLLCRGRGCRKFSGILEVTSLGAPASLRSAQQRGWVGWD